MLGITSLNQQFRIVGSKQDSDDTIMVDANIWDPEFDDNVNVINTFPDASGVNEYLDSFDQNVPAEEYLNDEQIINLVQFEEMNENGNDSGDRYLWYQQKNATKIVNFFEQQKNDEKFKPDDLRIFRKYLGIVRLMEPKIQSSIHEYFKKNN